MVAPGEGGSEIDLKQPWLQVVVDENVKAV